MLDKKDRRLLYALDLDGRATYTHLAKKTGMSKQLVKYRIGRLEKEGIIKGYHAMIDTSRLGMTTFRVYLKLRNVTPSKKEELIAFLKQRRQVWALVLMTGKWDIALGVGVRDIYDFYDVWDLLLEQHLPSISDYAISVYSPIHHFSKSYLLDREDTSDPRILGGRGEAEHDETDIAILLAISRDARMPIIDVAKEAGVTAETASSRLKRLQSNGIIQGYRATIDVAKLGYEFFKAEIRLADYSKRRQIHEYCHRHPNIYQVDKTIGGETLEVEFHVHGVREMLSIIEEMESRFPGSIEEFDYLTVLSEEKMVYMPELRKT